MKTTIAFALLITGSFSAFAADSTITNDRNSVDQSCANEGQVARCGNDVVGKVLYDCINNYKKAHAKTYEISSGCKIAIEKLHTDKKANK